MKKLFVLFCISLFILPTALANSVALPDPGRSFSALGELLAQGAEADGVQYDVYGYTFEKKVSTSLSSMILVYQTKAKKAGFTWELLADKSDYDGIRGDYWYTLLVGGILCVDSRDE